MKKIFRTAEHSDVKQMQVVRHLVKENVVTDPEFVTDKDVEYYITQKGKGWICEVDNKVVGFSIIDLKERSVWALFVDPEFAEKGIGKELHRLMIDWYFQQTKDNLQLGTEPNTRAEIFYSLQGWKVVSILPNGETKFELSYGDWKKV